MKRLQYVLVHTQTHTHTNKQNKTKNDVRKIKFVYNIRYREDKSLLAIAVFLCGAVVAFVACT